MQIKLLNGKIMNYVYSYLYSFKNVRQIVHDSTSLELELSSTGTVQKWRTLILDLLIGVGIRTACGETEIAERVHCEIEKIQTSGRVNISENLQQ